MTASKQIKIRMLLRMDFPLDCYVDKEIISLTNAGFA